MNALEKALEEKKDDFNRIDAPEEMEVRLRQALQRKNKRRNYKPLSIVLIAVILLTYSFDTLAYYGKKFTGYDRVAAGSLKKLNEEGRGQVIGKSYTFSNGAQVTIDGILFDKNELVVFYKLHTSSGKLQDVLDYNLPRLHAYGLKPGGYFFQGGHGVIEDDQTMTFMDTLEAPMFYEKWMRFDIELVINKKMEIGSINFTLNRNQAMNRTVNTNLNTEARLGDYRILFNHLTASAMSSVLDGRIIPLTDTALNVFKAKTSEAFMEIPLLCFDIVSDTGKVSEFRCGHGASNDNISFSGNSDALPENFKTLQIRNIRMETMKLVDKTVDIGVETKALQLAEDLFVTKVYQDAGDTCVVISSRGIPGIGLFEGEKQIEQVSPESFDRIAESEKPVERIYRFKGMGDNLKIMIKYIRYSKYSKDTVNIPSE